MRGTDDDPTGATGARILVVEDNATIREVVVQVLTDEGYEVLGAPDGRTALDLATRSRPPVSVVVLDLQLPDMDGRAFAAGYARLPVPQAPLIVFSAAAPVEAAAAAEELGATGFVTKPFELDTLVAVIARCLPALAPVESPPALAPVESLPLFPHRLQRPPSLPTATGRWEPDARRRQLARLRDEVTRVQATLTQVRAALERLAAVEATRRLTRDEARQVTALRLQSEALHLELARVHREFTRLQEAGRSPGLA